MTFSQQGSVGTAARPSTDTAVAEIPGTIGDEEKNPVGLDDHLPQADLEGDRNVQEILNTAWGKHGKIYMWIGFVLPRRGNTVNAN
jgi:hypothetical protein